MRVIKEYKIKSSLGGHVVIVKRDPFIVTIKKDGKLAVEQDSANGYYCTTLKAAESIVKGLK
jgi:hypothetical protein